MAVEFVNASRLTIESDGFVKESVPIIFQLDTNMRNVPASDPTQSRLFMPSAKIKDTLTKMINLKSTHRYGSTTSSA